jgi:hypothetical protein
MSVPHQRYHSDLKTEYLNGDLSPDIIKSIPRSTRQRWREQKEKTFWMPEPLEHNIIDGLTIRKLRAENKLLKVKGAVLYRNVL